MSDESWEPDLTLSLSMSHTLTLSLSQSHSLSFTHSRHTEQLLFSCLCSKVTLSISHSHSYTLSFSHSLTLDLLNNFCFHVKAQKSMFIAKNCNGFFYTTHHIPWVWSSWSWLPAKNQAPRIQKTNICQTWKLQTKLSCLSYRAFLVCRST